MEVYIIRNSVNNKVYIGQTTKTKEERFKEHIQTSKLYFNHPFYNSIRKYGSDVFTINSLKICDTIDELNYWEEFYIKEYNSLSPNGYNLLPGGNNKRQHSSSIKKIQERMKYIATTDKFKERSIKSLVQYSKSEFGREHYRKLAIDEWNNTEYREKQQEVRKYVYTEEWKSKITSTTRNVMQTKTVRENYLKGYLGFLIRKKRVFTESFLKFSEELKMINKQYLDYCANAFTS